MVPNTPVMRIILKILDLLPCKILKILGLSCKCNSFIVNMGDLFTQKLDEYLRDMSILNAILMAVLFAYYLKLSIGIIVALLTLFYVFYAIRSACKHIIGSENKK